MSSEFQANSLVATDYCYCNTILDPLIYNTNQSAKYVIRLHYRNYVI